MRIRKIIVFIFLVVFVIFISLILIKVNYLELIMPFLTFLTIVFVLFKKDLIYFLEKPRLNLICTIQDLYEISHISPSFLESFLGIRIINFGETPAKDVKLYFNGISSNVIKDFQNYRGLPLRKGWTGGENIKNLYTKIPIRYDICRLSDIDINRIDFSFKHTPEDLTEIMCIQYELSYFEFEIVAVAENAKPERKIFKIEFYGDYTKDFKIKVKK